MAWVQAKRSGQEGSALAAEPRQRSAGASQAGAGTRCARLLGWEQSLGAALYLQNRAAAGLQRCCHTGVYLHSRQITLRASVRLAASDAAASAQHDTAAGTPSNSSASCSSQASCPLPPPTATAFCVSTRREAVVQMPPLPSQPAGAGLRAAATPHLQTMAATARHTGVQAACWRHRATAGGQEAEAPGWGAVHRETQRWGAHSTWGAGEPSQDGCESCSQDLAEQDAVLRHLRHPHPHRPAEGDARRRQVVGKRGAACSAGKHSRMRVAATAAETKGT